MRVCKILKQTNLKFTLKAAAKLEEFLSYSEEIVYIS